MRLKIRFFRVAARKQKKQLLSILDTPADDLNISIVSTHSNRKQNQFYENDWPTRGSVPDEDCCSWRGMYCCMRCEQPDLDF